MKWFKRSLLSITRRPGKSLLLFLVVCAMVSLLAGSLSIINTANNVKNELKRGFGAIASISTDSTLLPEENYETIFSNYISGVETLRQNEWVDYGEYRLSASGYACGDLGQEFSAVFLGMSLPQSEQFRSGEWELSGQINSRNFTQKELDNGERVAVVNISLASTSSGNEVFSTGITSIGNTIPMKIQIPYREVNEQGFNLYHTFTYEFELKIIGTFVDHKSDASSILIPNHALIDIMQEAREEAQKQGLNTESRRFYPDIDYAGYKMKDPQHLSEFDAEAKAFISTLPNGFHYESSNTNYQKNAGPVENLDLIARIIFIAALVATLLILGMVITYLIGDRKKEIGIYMSLGEKSHSLISQFLMEILIISTLAIGTAGISGYFLGNGISDYMMQIQSYVKREQELGIRAQYTPYNSSETLEKYSRENILAEYQNEINAQYFLILFVVGESSVLLSCLIPMIYMIHLKPKEILLGGE